MESRQFGGLSQAVRKFKAALLESLNTNSHFHQALNGDEPLTFYGLTTGEQEPNQYFIEISELLFWLDSEGYLDELERWEGAQIKEKHRQTLAYLRESEQTTVFSGLIEAVKRKRIAPFVGAGLSKPCGFPLWGQAIRQLVEKLEGVSLSEKKAANSPFVYLNEVVRLLDENRYLEAVQILYRENRIQVENFIRNKFDLIHDSTIKGPVNLLPEICDGCIITTNFDALIENVFLNQNRPINGYMHGTQTQNQFVPKLIQGERCILKLHGDVTDPATYIFSQEQYDSAYGIPLDFTRPLAKTLRQIFISHSLLFLGCSLEQDRTMDLFEAIVAENSFDIPDHYALLSKPSDHQAFLEKENLLTETKIRPIWYIVDENGSHYMLEALLSLVVDCAKGRTRI
jgi:hypothetical protein